MTARKTNHGGRGGRTYFSLLLAPAVAAASFSGCQCTVYDDDGFGGFGGTAEGGSGGGVEEQACSISNVSPDFGAEDVAVAGEVFTIEWTQAIDSVTATSGVRLVRLDDGEEVPIQVTAVDDTHVEVTPLASLRFWSDYGLEIDGISTPAGDACTGQNTAFSTPRLTPEEAAVAPAPVNGMVVLGTVGIIASQQFRGLQIYDLSTPDQPVLTGSVDTAQQPVSIATDGTHLYVPTGYEGVLIFETADPKQPKLVGVAGTPGYAQKAVPFTRDAKQYIAIADGSGGLRVVDVTKADGPKPVFALNPLGSPTMNITGVWVEGDLLATADWDRGFSLVDISTLTSPTVLSTTLSEAVPDTQNQSFMVWDVALDADVAYVSLGVFGVQAFDITDRTAPAFIDHEPGPQGVCQFNCADPLNNFTFSDGEIFASSFLTGAVRMHLEGDTLVTDATLPVVGHTFSVTPAGDYLYTGSGSGLVVFDRAAADAAAALYEEPNGVGAVYATAVNGEYLYSATAYRGLETYSLANPEQPTRVDVDVTQSIQRDVQIANLAIQGNRIVVLDGRAGVSIYDITNPADPVLTGDLSTEIIDRSSAIEFNGDVAYICNDNQGLLVIDYVSTPPTLLNAIPLDEQLTACRDLEITGERLVVAESKALGIYDISTPAAPVLETQFLLPAEDAVNGIELYGNYLLASTAVDDFEGTFSVTYRFVVFDLSDLTNPKVAYRSDNLGGARAILRTGDKAFIAGGREGVFVYDLSDPAQPYLEGVAEFPGLPASLTPSLARDALYVAERGRGISLIQSGLLPAD